MLHSSLLALLTFCSGPQSDQLLPALMRADAAAVGRVVSENPASLNEPLIEGANPGAKRLPPPLHVAARRNLMAVARVLLERGADPNGRDAAGNTPLHSAMLPEMVTLLVAAGADPRVTNTAGETPLETMYWYWWGGPFGAELAHALIDAGGELKLFEAVTLGWTQDVERLLAESPGEPPDARVLYRALDTGEVEIIDLLIDAGVDVDVTEPRWRQMVRNSWPRQSAVVAAIHRGHPLVAVRLLQAGATVGGKEGIRKARGWRLVLGLSIHERGKTGNLLDRVVDQGSAEAIAILVDRGLDPARPSERHEQDGFLLEVESHLVRAAWRGHVAAVDMLLDLGVAIDEPSMGATALLAAAAGRHAAVYDRLLARGATPSLPAAAAMGRVGEVRALLQSHPAELEVRGERCSWTPLAWAVQSGSLEAVDVLLAAGADVDRSVGVVLSWPHAWDARPRSLMPVDGLVGAFGQPREQGTTSVLAMSAERGHLDIASRLVDAGAGADRSSVTELCRNASPEATGTLERALRDAAVLEQDEGWAVPALSVLMTTDLPSTERLARYNALVQAGGTRTLVDESGLSILNSAHWGTGDGRLARTLLDAGAPFDLDGAAALGWLEEIRALQESRKITPVERQRMLRWSGDSGRVEVVLYLLDTVPVDESIDVHKFAIRLAWFGHEQVVAALVERGVLDLDRDGAELISRAAGAIRPDLLKWLVARGVDIQSDDEPGDSALHEACSGGRVENVRFLLAAGARVDARNRRGDTPLLSHLDSPTWHGLSPELIGLLLDAGADPLAIGRRRPHALAIAAREAGSNDVRSGLRAVFKAHVSARHLAILDDR